MANTILKQDMNKVEVKRLLARVLGIHQNQVHVWRIKLQGGAIRMGIYVEMVSQQKLDEAIKKVLKPDPIQPNRRDPHWWKNSD